MFSFKKYTGSAICLIILLCSWACRTDADESPTGPVIPAEVLSEVITEILIVDPAIREAPQEEQDSLAKVYYARILDQHGHTLREFTESMQWLQADPQRLQDTYEVVLEKATAFETELK